jgi:quercetin dioxygenase-like cupin family protein
MSSPPPFRASSSLTERGSVRISPVRVSMGVEAAVSSPEPGAPVFFAPPHPAAVTDGQIRVGWALAGQGRDLDANLVQLGPRAVIAEHTETVLGVLLIVLAGTGNLHTPHAVTTLAAGSLAWLPVGTTRTITAHAEGLTYVTAHRRRPSLSIGSRVQAEGGEPVCLLDRVCVECGRLATERDASFCSRCGTPLPT